MKGPQTPAAERSLPRQPDGDQRAGPRIVFFGDSLTAGFPGSSYLALLRSRLPQYTLLNQGRGNDTVVSLYRRLVRLRLHGPLDLAFLWVGVNDAPGRIPGSNRVVNLLRRQPRARTLAEFRTYYAAVLELLSQVSGGVVAVGPLCRGEDLGSLWNRRLALLVDAIEDLASCRPGVAFLDLRPAAAEYLAGRPISGYLPGSVMRVAVDILALRTDERVDRKSEQRGLHLTLDGLHLNGAGARLVADAFERVIREACPPRPAGPWGGC